MAAKKQSDEAKKAALEAAKKNVAAAAGKKSGGDDKDEPKKPVRSAEDEEEPEKPKKPKAEKPEPEEAPEREEKTVKEKATGKRVAAIILWVVAILFEVVAILVLNKTIYLGGDLQTIALFAALGLDLICVIIASQLWKKANHTDPASKANKLKFFLWNNLGVIASLLAFVPFIIILLTNKDLDPKNKKLATIVAIVALVIAAATSVDYNPVSKEDFEAEAEAAMAEAGESDGTVYWTTFGKKYHLYDDCQAIANSSNKTGGTIEEAFEGSRTELCKFCEREAGIDDPTNDAEPAAEEEGVLEEVADELEELEVLDDAA